MANINETINNIEKVNPELAEQVRKYVKNHSYGLVYEQNLPDAIRLYNKKIQKGDTVNILPPRGKKEKKENNITWIVNDINSDGTAYLTRDDDSTSANVDDLVTLVDYQDVIYPGLKEIDRVEHGNEDDPYHVLLNAENYHALEALGYMYNGTVDCIYIDPPYNTGAKDWKYNNNYVDDNDRYRHSKWLTFMERRLKLAKNLLNPQTGIIIVTIDDYEVSRLTMLMDQIFGEKAHLGTVVIKNNPQGRSMPSGFQVSHEYALFYGMPNAVIGDLDRSDKQLSRYNQTDSKGSFEWRNFRAQYSKISQRLIYSIYVKKDATDFRIPDLHWDDNEKKYIADESPAEDENLVMPYNDKGQLKTWKWSINTVMKNKNTEMGVRLDRHKNPTVYFKGRMKNKGMKPFTVWDDPKYSASTFGANLIGKIIGSNKFDYPKSIYSVLDCLRVGTNNNSNAKIIDFFAGSSTTLHAVNILNSEDNGKRSCICVTNNELSDDESSRMIKNGFRPGDEEWESLGIANNVSWPRTKLSIEGIDYNGDVLKGNYGIERDEYVPDKDDIIVSKNTGERVKKVTFYKKDKISLDKKLSNIKLGDGFKSNAIFLELTYENAWPIRLDKAFNAIAPILWMQSGSKGRIINKINDGYDFTSYYGVLFDYSKASEFCKAVKNITTIKTVFVVTDNQRRYSNIVKKLPNVNVNRLYESYLKTFQIYGEGRFD